MSRRRLRPPMRIAAVHIPFFAIVAHRRRDRDLRNRPLLLVDATGRGGKPVVVARSPEAVRLGVLPGAPAASAAAGCPDAILCPIDLPYCRAEHERVRAALFDAIPEIEDESLGSWCFPTAGPRTAARPRRDARRRRPPPRPGSRLRFARRRRVGPVRRARRRPVRQRERARRRPRRRSRRDRAISAQGAADRGRHAAVARGARRADARRVRATSRGRRALTIRRRGCPRARPRARHRRRATHRPPRSPRRRGRTRVRSAYRSTRRGALPPAHALRSADGRARAPGPRLCRSARRAAPRGRRSRRDRRPPHATDAIGADVVDAASIADGAGDARRSARGRAARGDGNGDRAGGAAGPLSLAAGLGSTRSGHRTAHRTVREGRGGHARGRRHPPA
ncbi:MAG: hypothetical protein IPF82_09735 [Blastocatellia bacterium]|nr:hypothetical protein [Blastocatellia bacterium]